MGKGKQWEGWRLFEKEWSGKAFEKRELWHRDSEDGRGPGTGRSERRAHQAGGTLASKAYGGGKHGIFTRQHATALTQAKGRAGSPAIVPFGGHTFRVWWLVSDQFSKLLKIHYYFAKCKSKGGRKDKAGWNTDTAPEQHTFS